MYFREIHGRELSTGRENVKMSSAASVCALGRTRDGEGVGDYPVTVPVSVN